MMTMARASLRRVAAWLPATGDHPGSGRSVPGGKTSQRPGAGTVAGSHAATRRRNVPVLIGVLAFCGCSSPVTFEQRTLREALRAEDRAWPAAELSGESRAEIEWRGLTPSLDAAGELAAVGTPRATLAAAELYLLAALDEGDRERRAGLLLDAAGVAQRRLTMDETTGPPTWRAWQIHRYAAAGLVEDGWLLDGGRIVEAFDVGGREVRVVVRRAKEAGAVPDIRRLRAADLMAIDGFDRRHRRYGVGTPIVCYRDPAPGRADRPSESHYPDEGIAFDLTALLDVTEDRATLELLDPHEVGEVELAGRTRPLAADFSAAYAVLGQHAEVTREAWLYLLEPGRGRERLGIYMLEPYQPDEIPVLLIHGLLSSPAAWHEVQNAINGDERLRERYQVWNYFYPTGYPWALSGLYLRRGLRDIENRLGPGALDGTVIVAHSMGGLVAKGAVTDSADGQLWAGVHARPLGELGLPAETEAFFRDGFHYGPVEGVGRVVMMSVPLTGAPMATGWLAQLGRSFVTLPDEATGHAEALRRHAADGIRPWFRERGVLVPDGIEELSPEMPVVRAMAGMPVVGGVPVHLIWGEQDGVVPRESALAAEAESTLVLDGTGHGSLLDPVAVREVTRILHQHLDELDAAGD